ncbi:MAG: glycosyltransferase [Chitinophagales bacterium]
MVEKIPKIIVAPLDWGLGHATRCIPIIYELIKASCEVLIAAEGAPRAILTTEFPGIRVLDLPGYQLRYGRNAWLTRLRIGMQIPKIVQRIRRERSWLTEIIAKEDPDAIISDNRYGLCAPGLRSVFLTHQLHIKTGLGAFLDHLVEKWNHRKIRRFSACWIPDYMGDGALSGELSHPAIIPGMDIRFIGPLSRFVPCKEAVSDQVLILLSGPEPQRSILEKQVLRQCMNYRSKVILVRGLPLESPLPMVEKHVSIHNHLQTEILNKLICESAIIICRSGYSSIMDIMRLGKKSILIPTPGQSEQQYLGQWMHENKLALCVTQNRFSILTSLQEAEKFHYDIYTQRDATLLQGAVSDLLAHCRS